MADIVTGDTEKLESVIGSAQSLISEITNIKSELKSAISNINSQVGVGTLVESIPTSVCDNFDTSSIEQIHASLIAQKSQLEDYDRATNDDKGSFFGNLFGGVAQGVSGVFEGFVDAGATLIGLGAGALGFDGAKSKISEFVAKDWSYEVGKAVGNTISGGKGYNENSGAAKFGKFAGTVATYIALPGGSMVVDAAIGAASGFGQGTQKGLRSGKTLNQAAAQDGLKSAAKEAATAVAANVVFKVASPGIKKVTEKISNTKVVKAATNKVSTVTEKISQTTVGKKLTERSLQKAETKALKAEEKLAAKETKLMNTTEGSFTNKMASRSVQKAEKKYATANQELIEKTLKSGNEEKIISLANKQVEKAQSQVTKADDAFKAADERLKNATTVSEQNAAKKARNTASLQKQEATKNLNGIKSDADALKAASAKKATSETVETSTKKATSETAEASATKATPKTPETGTKSSTSGATEQSMSKKSTEQFRRTEADIKKQQEELLSQRKTYVESRNAAAKEKAELHNKYNVKPESLKGYDETISQMNKNIDDIDNVLNKASENGAPKSASDSAFSNITDTDLKAYQDKASQQFRKASDNGAPKNASDSAFANTPTDEWVEYRSKGSKAAEQKAAENAKNAENFGTKASDNGAPKGASDSAFAETPDDVFDAYQNGGAKAAEQKAAENAKNSENLFKKASDNGAPTSKNSALADTPDKEFFDYQRRNGISTPTDELEAAKKVLSDVTTDASKGTKGILNKATAAVKKHPKITGAAAVVVGGAAIYNAVNNEKANNQFKSTDDGSKSSEDNDNSNDNSATQQTSTGNQPYSPQSGNGGSPGGGGDSSGASGVAQYRDSSVSTTAPATVATTPPTTAAPTTAMTTPPTTAAPTTAMTTPPTTAAPTTEITTPPTSVQPTSAPTTLTPTSINPGTTTTTTGGTYHTGGGYSGTGGYTENNPTLPTDVTTETTSGLDDIKDTLSDGTTSIEDVIKGSKYTKIPSTPSPVITSSTSGGASAVIPIAAGLSAAAAAGIGAKAYMDRKKNNDNGEDEDEFETDEWSGDDSVDIQYDDSSDNENYLDADDDYSYQTADSSEKYDARSSDELADLQ